MQRLNGKTALITGGSSGIGLATAQLFQAEGARVAVTGRSTESLQPAGQLLGEQALLIASDAANLKSIEQLMIQVANTLGGLDILVLNAGVARPAPLEMTDEEQFDETADTNFKGVFFAIQKALPILRPGASIIVTTSITNQLGSPNFSVYAACKAALRSLVGSLALELIARQIRINAVSPGPIATPMFDRFGLPAEASQAIKAQIQAKSPIGRFGGPDELAKVNLFLASDDSSYIVGEEIVVDGGMSLL
ncbi:MAG TPA: SDR family oxidoreductase [Azonexus sp.]|nr:SDR family oxidoreductase [Azonexus sp.]